MNAARRSKAIITVLLLLTALCCTFTMGHVFAQGPTTGGFKGRVIDMATGKPISGADVVLRNVDLDRKSTVITDADGNFVKSGLMPGDYSISVMADGYVTPPTWKQVLNATDTYYIAGYTNGPIVLERAPEVNAPERPKLPDIVTGAFKGRVLDQNGNPIPGAKVAMRIVDLDTITTVMTDGDGNFVKSDLVPGDYDISVTADGYVTPPPRKQPLRTTYLYDTGPIVLEHVPEANALKRPKRLEAKAPEPKLKLEMITTPSTKPAISRTAVVPPPLTYPKIVTALSAKLPPGLTKSKLIQKLIDDIERLGVDKPLTADREDDLRQAGATDELIDAIRLNSPALPKPSSLRTPDIAYNTNTYTKTAGGKVVEKGNTMQIWKLIGGKWRIVLDIFKPVP